MTDVQTTPADLETIGKQLDDALEAIDGLEPDAKAVATEVRDVLLTMHREALVSMVRALKDDPRGKEILFDLVDDPAIRLMLSMHGIIRPDPRTQINQIIDAMRPQLQSYGGTVELVDLADGVATLRYEGTGSGCNSNSAVVRDGIEQALLGAVPGLVRVDVVEQPAAVLIPLSTIGLRKPDSEPGWIKTMSVAELPDTKVAPMSLTPADGAAVEVIVTNLDGEIAAFVNECAHQGMPLDGAVVDVKDGLLTCPWHGYCFDARTGECMTMPGAQLSPLPVKVDDGVLWIKVA